MSLNWARLPITHFENWARAIRFVVPDFFKKEEPDMDAVAVLDAETIRARMNGGSPREDGLHTARTIEPFLRAEEKRITEGIAMMDQRKELLEQQGSLLDQTKKWFSGPDEQEIQVPERTALFVPGLAGLEKRSKKLNVESQYLVNGLLDEHTTFDTLIEEQLIFLHDFNYCGRKLFRIEEQITHELTLTHVEGVLAQFFKLPYQTICVHVPYNQVIRMHDLPVVWCYLSEYEEEDGRHIHCMYVTTDGFPSFFEFVLDDNKPLGEQVKGQVGEKYGKAAAKEHMAVFSMIASMVLYMNSEGRDIRELKPRVTDARKDSRLATCSIGGTIKVDRTLYMGSNEDGTASERTMHILKWTVRGHFRNQAHGAGMKERRIQWIRPYLKGRERGNEKMPAKNTEYTVSITTP